MAVLQRNSMLEKSGVTVNESSLHRGQRRTRGQKSCYRPLIHRTLPIGTLIVIALAFIGLIELSLRKLPQTDSSTKSPQGRLQRRQVGGPLSRVDGASPYFRPAAQTRFLGPDILSIPLQRSTSTSISVGAPPPSKFLNAETTAVTLVTAPSRYLNPQVTSLR